MSYSEEQVSTTPINRLLTGFIHYTDTNDLTKLFGVLKKFREENGLKYSHQSNVNMVFFIVSSEHLNALSEKTPFKISRYQTTSKYYNCDEETSGKLLKQKDSFLRMSWDQESRELTFLSRTPFKVHGNLVRRIFKDSNVDFPKGSYSVLKNNASDSNVSGTSGTHSNTRKFNPGYGHTRSNVSHNHKQTVDSTFAPVKEPESELVSVTVYDPTSTLDNENTSSASATPITVLTHEKLPSLTHESGTGTGSEGFQRVEKTKKPRNNTNSKVVKETENKPKIRGGKTSRVPKSTV